MEKIAIEFINQAGGLLPRELVQAAAEAFGPTRYHTADPTLMAPPTTLVPAPAYQRTSFFTRFYSWTQFTFVVGCRVLLAPRRPLLFIVTNPPFSPLLGYLANKLKRQRYIILYYDFHPEAMERFAGVSPQSAVSRLLRFVNRIAIRNAEAVITISKGLEQTLSQYYPSHGPALRTHIIPTWVDTNVIKPLSKEDNWFARQHGQTDKLTVLYSGNLGSVHDLSMLPELAASLQDDPGIQFMVLAEPEGRRSLEAQCRTLGLQNITFLPLQTEAVLPFSLATADIGLVALARGAEGVSMPSKTYYLMAAGCAVLGFSHPGSDLAEVIQNHKCGLNVLPDDVASASAAIRGLREDPAALKAMRTHARQAAEAHFSRSGCVSEMLAAIRPALAP